VGLRGAALKRWQRILWAAALDTLLGDPPWRFHPARLMGRLATRLESPGRRLVAEEKLAGALVATAVVGCTVAAVGGVLGLARRLHPWAEDLASVVMLYWALAARDLADHARRVECALTRGDLAGARTAVGRIVGRDTEVLDEEGVVRATVESVAENTVDGVIAPLFWAFVGGAPAAMAFKAVSTLDSTFGYRNERYLRFGWASARLDDVANYLPARVAVPLVALGAALLGGSPTRVGQTVKQYGRKHASPNSGLAEAAFAGSLGVRLGGPLYRQGEPVELPFIGTAEKPLTVDRIREAVRLMWFAYGLGLAAGVLGSRCGRGGKRGR